MGQVKGRAHQQRRDPERHLVREAVAPARPETIRLSIEALARAIADPALAHQRRHNLELMSELRYLLGRQ